MQEDDNIENGQVENISNELHPALDLRNRWLKLISDKYCADLEDCFKVLMMIRHVVELPRPVPFKNRVFSRMSVEDLEFGRLSLEAPPDIYGRVHNPFLMIGQPKFE